ncbi:MAG: hypothetical protein JGK17_04440 [Microcoleus sp. PH2017_10_PVI_O_A]|nr:MULTISPECIES: hypothetical protein [unclassified Microcoleus]MCC3404836.1 hypothetical protein [Microcoleus sp. PH2017_10_PVI_O_A]MCC3458942.1 hypothetical protein [Microcoleus sp. PH2017_11_PCY_U_A]MCC3477143.1 hypothetical protein [Microcoleus sp. PH2017_12_PCY_D_A]MCC3526688.1 hypothetical protein [Microcoleus sp. PH2017_21_RUC_O_A]MCC3539190.1 hypothetical protein [Microcoleus sp. PH2017_22_RUC_O_B]
MNSLMLISPAQAWGFKPILCGKSLGASKNSVANNDTQALGFQLLLRSKT